MIVLRSGSDTEMTSGFGGEEARIIAEAPGLETGPDGPLASPELFVIVDHPLQAHRHRRQRAAARRDAARAEGAADGEDRRGPDVRQPGTNEIIVGRAASRQFAGLDVGRPVRWGENAWTGRRDLRRRRERRRVRDLVRRRVLQPAYRRGNSYQSVYARLASPDSFQTFKDALTTDPRLR